MVVVAAGRERVRVRVRDLRHATGERELEDLPEEAARRIALGEVALAQVDAVLGEEVAGPVLELADHRDHRADATHRGVGDVDLWDLLREREEPVVDPLGTRGQLVVRELPRRVPEPLRDDREVPVDDLREGAPRRGGPERRVVVVLETEPVDPVQGACELRVVAVESEQLLEEAAVGGHEARLDRGFGRPATTTSKLARGPAADLPGVPDAPERERAEPHEVVRPFEAWDAERVLADREEVELEIGKLPDERVAPRRQTAPVVWVRPLGREQHPRRRGVLHRATGAAADVPAHR